MQTHDQSNALLATDHPSQQPLCLAVCPAQLANGQDWQHCIIECVCWGDYNYYYTLDRTCKCDEVMKPGSHAGLDQPLHFKRSNTHLAAKPL
jgi:hypothetical protein